MAHWFIYKGRYQGFPEYTTRITGHYAGDMLLLEEIGEISARCAGKLFANTNVIPNTLYELDGETIANALEMNECSQDKDILGVALKTISDGASILVRLKS